MDLNKKIENLFEGLSDLTEEDLAEAREILKASGKNPDEILARAMKQLRTIQRQARSISKSIPLDQLSTRHLSYPVIVRSGENSRFLELTYKTDKNSVVLPMADVVALFVRRTSLNGISLSEFECAEVIRNISFRKITREIITNISFENGQARVSFYLDSTSSLSIDAIDVVSILQTGYIISDLTWIPIEKQSIEFIQKILNNMNADSVLDYHTAIEHYFHRDDIPSLRFTPVELSIDILTKGVSDGDPGTLFVRDLYNYQKDGLRWLQHCATTRTGGILGDDMGLGKTAQIISMIAWATKHEVFSSFLIVVPGTLLENWRREFQFFAPSIKPFIHHGSDRTGSVKILQEKRIVITSYSMVINDQYLFDKIQWDMIIADEASLLKNPDSERRVAFKAIPAKLKIVMTGTPVENSLMDLWSLADLTNEGFFGNRADFTRKYIRKDIDSTIQDSGLGQLQKDLSLIMLRRKKEEVLDSLPEKIDIHQPLVMSEREAWQYDQERSMILSKKDSGALILELIQELRKFTTHPLLSTDKDILKAGIEELANTSVKFKRTLEILEEIRLSQEKVLIFTEYLDMIDIFTIVFTRYFKIPVYTIDGRIKVEQRQMNIDEFSAQPGFAIMILNPRTAGMGLNITAANHVIHYTRQWNPALEEQATGRSYRNKQTKGVNVYYLFYSNTIEEVIDDRLRLKRQLSQQVVTSTQDELSMDEYLKALNRSPTQKNK